MEVRTAAQIFEAIKIHCQEMSSREGEGSDTSGLARLENLRPFLQLSHLAAADFFASLSRISFLIRPLSRAQSMTHAINHDQDVQAVKFVVQITSDRLRSRCPPRPRDAAFYFDRGFPLSAFHFS